MFADDLMMMAESKEALQHNMQELNDRLKEWEMKADSQKTRVMRIGRKKDVCKVEVNGQEVEQVEVMKYLGVMISNDGSMDSEVEQRIGMASEMTGAIGRTVLGRKELMKGTKVQVVNAGYDKKAAAELKVKGKDEYQYSDKEDLDGEIPGRCP